MSEVDDAVEAIRGGRLAVVPTDTVYGLATSAYSEGPVRELYRVKGRDQVQPTALVAAGVDLLFECVPELRGKAGVIVRALLPGPYTLVLPNPGRRFHWLTGTRPDTIGVRVPVVDGPAREVISRVGAMVATSANLAGGPDPTTVDEVPAEIRDEVVAVVDAGRLPGTPSTVIDLTGSDPVVLREGVVAAEEALRAVASVL